MLVKVRKRSRENGQVSIPTTQVDLSGWKIDYVRAIAHKAGIEQFLRTEDVSLVPS
jgi:hypothetical protein